MITPPTPFLSLEQREIKQSSATPIIFFALISLKSINSVKTWFFKYYFAGSAVKHTVRKFHSITALVSVYNLHLTFRYTFRSKNPFVSDIVEGVDAVLMHGATCLYGSDSDTPDSLTNPVQLENTTIANVTPFLYYSPSAYISDQDMIPPLAHNNGDNGSFVACTIEIHAGLNKSGVIVVSGVLCMPTITTIGLLMDIQWFYRQLSLEWTTHHPFLLRYLCLQELL